MNYIERQKKLLALLKDKSFDAFLVRKKQNIAYLTNTKGEDALLFVSTKKNFLITDSRYKEEYAKSIKNCQLVILKDKSIYASLGDICKKIGLKRIGFESNSFSYLEYAVLKKELKNKKLIPFRGAVENLRMIKENGEIEHIKKACKDGCGIMNYAIKSLKPGLSEKYVKLGVEEYIIKKGLKRADFDIIVASGKNASMPHASASDKKTRIGEMVVIDLGAMDYGYNSDLTRTVFLGKINRKFLYAHDTVKEAQKRAIEKIKPGIQLKYIDSISREYIRIKGFGQYFLHSLGHGIGLETHEKPAVSSNSDIILKKNMVITVEPGIYIPGWGGVRIEDVVLVTEKGCEVLTKDAGLCK